MATLERKDLITYKVKLLHELLVTQIPGSGNDNELFGLLMKDSEVRHYIDYIKRRYTALKIEVKEYEDRDSKKQD